MYRARSSVALSAHPTGESCRQPAGDAPNWRPSSTTKFCSTVPPLVKMFTGDNPPRPAARAIRSLKAEEAYGDSVHRPYLHLVDGGVSDNVGMRAVLDGLEILEALHEAGIPTPLENAKR